MKEQLLKAWAGVREYWAKLAPKVKKLIVACAALILVAAIVVTVFLNTSTGGMKVLYPELSSAETAQVYATLTDMNVTPQINAKGEIMVPEDQWGELQLELAGKGYPQSAPAYDTYLNNTGFTRTDQEKRQIAIYSLQDRLQEALVQTHGVKSATVFISVPESSGYVWETKSQESSASVTITMEPGFDLSSERVSAVRNLVAFSVAPQMKPENVKVVDGSTGIEIQTEDSLISTSGVDFRRLEFEKQMQKDIEDNIKRLLSPIYGAEGVTAVAKVTLDYDKMLTEQREVVPGDNGDGVKTHLEENYSTGSEVPASGLVGEENNTDTPVYENQTTDANGNPTNYRREIDWENSYIKKQIEKGQAILKDASVSVVVNDPEFDKQRQDDLVDLISKSVAIRPDSISVKNLDFTAVQTGPTEPEKPDEQLPQINRTVLIMVAAGGLLLIIAIITLIAILLHRKNKKQLQQEETESENKIKDLQAEIEQHKKELVENAQAHNSKENAITNEIRDFAKENPEITASLLRSMLKEDE